MSKKMQDVKESLEQKAEQQRLKALEDYKIKKIVEVKNDIEYNKETLEQAKKHYEAREKELNKQIVEIKKEKVIPSDEECLSGLTVSSTGNSITNYTINN